MRFATEQLSVALWQSQTQFLSGTGFKKTRKLKHDQYVLLMVENSIIEQ